MFDTAFLPLDLLHPSFFSNSVIYVYDLYPCDFSPEVRNTHLVCL